MDQEPPNQLPDEPFRFTLAGLLWFTALIATGIGAFGPGFGVYASLLAIFIAYLLSRPKRLVSVVVAILIVHLFIAMLVPAVASARQSARRSMSFLSLKQLSLALLNYESSKQRFPEPATLNSNKEKLHSWRTSILPFIEEAALYDKIDQALPWDAPANAKLLQEHPLEFMQSYRLEAFDEPFGNANYFAVVGEETMWPVEGGVSTKSVSDGLANTILLIESPGMDSKWYEPRDLSLDEAVDLLCGGGPATTWVDQAYFVSTQYEGNWPEGVIVAFADGGVQRIAPMRDRKLARALFTRSGNEYPSTDERDRLDHSPEELPVPKFVAYIVHWDHVIPAILFLAIAVVPWHSKARKRLFGKL